MASYPTRVRTNKLRRRIRRWLSEDTFTVDKRDQLVRALRTLPERERACVVLRHYADLSELDTADVLGVSLGTVKSSTSRGLARLRTALPLGDLR